MTQRRKFLLSIYCFDATEGRINSTQLLSLLFFHFNQVKAYLPIPTYFDPLMMMVVQCRSSIYFLIVMCRFTNYMVSGQVNLYFRRTKADWKLVKKSGKFLGFKCGNGSKSDHWAWYFKPQKMKFNLSWIINHYS